jgi:hypothetical protein
MTRSIFLAALASLLIVFCLHKVIAGPLVMEPNAKGIFALEVVAVTLVFVALTSDEILKHSKGEQAGVSVRQIALVFGTVLASGFVYIAIVFLARLAGIPL